MVVGSEVSLLLIHMTQYCCTNSYPAIFYLIWFLVVGLNLESENLPDKLVNLWIFTIGLTSSGCRPHTSSFWPWSGMPKVHLYNTFLGSLRDMCWLPYPQNHITGNAPYGTGNATHTGAVIFKGDVTGTSAAKAGSPYPQMYLTGIAPKYNVQYR